MFSLDSCSYNFIRDYSPVELSILQCILLTVLLSFLSVNTPKMRGIAEVVDFLK